MYGITAGVRFPGHISASYHHPVKASSGDGEAAAAAAAAATAPSADEYICTDRARAVVSTVFPDPVKPAVGGEPTIRSVLSAQIDSACQLWTELAHPPTMQQWTSMLGSTSISSVAGTIDPRCISVTRFLELMLAQYRVIDLQIRHSKWSRLVFDQVDSNRDGWIDFGQFTQLMSTAQPVHSTRELHHLFQNVMATTTAAARALNPNATHTTPKQMAFRAWRVLSKQLLDSGVVFPAISAGVNPTGSGGGGGGGGIGVTAPPPPPSHAVLTLIASHWSSFRPFFEGWHSRLTASRDERDTAAAITAKHLRFLLERELASAMQQRSTASNMAQTGTGAGAGAGAGGLSTSVSAGRTVTLYRGLLSLVMAHQSSHQLVSVGADFPLSLLRSELESLERTCVDRDRIFELKLSGQKPSAVSEQPTKASKFQSQSN